MGGSRGLPPLHSASLSGKPPSIPLYVILNPLRLGGKPFNFASQQQRSSSVAPLPDSHSSSRDLRLTKAPIVNEDDAKMDMHVDHPTIEVEASYFKKNSIDTVNSSLEITEEVNESTMDTSIEIEKKFEHISHDVEDFGFGSLSILSGGGHCSGNDSDTSSGSSFSSVRRAKHKLRHSKHPRNTQRMIGSLDQLCALLSSQPVKFAKTPEMVKKLRMRRQRHLARTAFDFQQLAV